MNNSKPDKEEKIIRFGCGSFAGVILGISNAFYFFDFEIGLTISLVIICAVGCGYFAMKFGDRFWEEISRWFY